jgi:cytochrome c553
MNPRFLRTLCWLPLWLVVANAAFANSPFKKVFDERYVKDSGNEEFQAAFRKDGCYVCHVKDKKKDIVNHYGNELAKLIPGNVEQRLDEARKGGRAARDAEEEKVLKELAEAMQKVEEIESPSGVTYGELFKSHQLPPHEGEFSTK